MVHRRVDVRTAVRAAASALVVAGLVAALLAPVGSISGCPDGGGCVVRTTNALFVPVAPWLWLPAALVAGVLTGCVVVRRAAHRAKYPAR